MKDVLLKDLPVAGIEYVFKPPGLPLIVKASGEMPSTSILVRGGPGTGKTTLATSLVHAIAKQHGGTALYMTTEFVPVEILYKARLLGLSDEQVVDWRGDAKLNAGTIRVEHLLRVKSGEQVVSSADRKVATIEAVWELLDPDTAPADQEFPVRAVAIDAFGLPDADSEDSALRNDLLTLVQMLEDLGISVVIIEEVGGGASHWLPFVTDIVFELSLDQDPDTGELIRRLTCPKSRYALSLPGPHDYGLDDGKPRVWPDLLAVADSLELSEPIEQPGFFLPLDNDEYIAVKRGTVMLSTYTSRLLIVAGGITPGFHGMGVDCGPLTRVWLPQDGRLLIPANEGPFSLGWAILRHAAENTLNAVLFQNVEFFLSRARFRSGILHVLQALGDLGLFVMVHGDVASLHPIVPIAEFVSGGRLSGVIRRRLPHHRARLSSLWLHVFVTATRSLANIREPPSTDIESEPSLSEIEQQLAFGQMAVMRAYQLVQSAQNPRGTDAGWLELAKVHHLLGADDLARQLSSQVSSLSKRVRSQICISDDLGAGQNIIGLSQDPLPESMLPLWQGLCAIYGENDIALAQLEQDGRTTADPDVLALYLRALAVRDRMDDMDRVIAEAADEHDLPPWFVARLHADLRLESETQALIEDAAERLQALSQSGELPPVHEAEVFYNLGLARDRLGKPVEAQAAYRRALEINPRLEAARRKLHGPA